VRYWNPARLEGAQFLFACDIVRELHLTFNFRLRLSNPMQSLMACGEISIGWPDWEYRNSPDRQRRRTAYTVVHISAAASGMVSKFLLWGMLGGCCGDCFLDMGSPFLDDLKSLASDYA
jgi:hypothetical protein